MFGDDRSTRDMGTIIDEAVQRQAERRRQEREAARGAVSRTLEDLFRAAAVQEAEERVRAEAWCAAEHAREEREREAAAAERATEERQSNFVMHLDAGHNYMTQGNYTLAIQEFEAALSFIPQAFMVRYRVACCNMELQNFPTAYKQLKNLNDHAAEIADYATRLSTCRKPTWDLMRESINSSLMQAATLCQLGALNLSHEILLNCKQEYEEFRDLLAEPEAANLQQVSKLLSRIERDIEVSTNHANQIFISDKLPSVLSAVANFNIGSALHTLEEICRAAGDITNPADAGPDYVDPSVWTKSYQELKQWAAAKDDRREHDPLRIADRIVGDPVFGSSNPEDRRFIRDVIIKHLRANWGAIDQRDPTALTESIRQTVKNNLSHSNFLLVCCLPPFYVADRSLFSQKIQTAIKDNLPQGQVPPIVLALHSIPSLQQQMPPAVVFTGKPQGGDGPQLPATLEGAPKPMEMVEESGAPWPQI